MRWAEIDGQCAATGVDPLALPTVRFFNLVEANLRAALAWAKEDLREWWEEKLAWPEAPASPATRDRLETAAQVLGAADLETMFDQAAEQRRLALERIAKRQAKAAEES